MGRYGVERVLAKRPGDLHVDLCVLEGPEELVDQPGLADPRVAQDVDDVRLPVGRRREGVGEQAELAFAPDESRQRPSLVRRLPTRPDLLAALKHVDRHLVGETQDIDAPTRLHGDEATDKLHRVAGEEDAAGLRHLLHAAREVDRLPDRVVVDRQVVADGAHHDLAGVQTHPDAQPFAGERGEAGLDRQRRVARPQCVMLLCQRGAKQRHHAVALDAGDETASVVDRVQDDREGPVDLLVPDLRVVADHRPSRPFGPTERNLASVLNAPDQAASLSRLPLPSRTTGTGQSLRLTRASSRCRGASLSKSPRTPVAWVLY